MHFMAHIDKQNRLTIPIEIRNMLGISPENVAYFETEKDYIILFFAEKELSLKYHSSVLDRKSRIIIPSIYRKFLNIKDDFISLSVSDDKVILRPVSSNCVFCGNPINDFFVSFKDKKICSNCMIEFKKIFD